MATNAPKCDHNLSYSTTPCPACKESALSPPATAQRIVGAHAAGGAFATSQRIEPAPQHDDRPLTARQFGAALEQDEKEIIAEQDSEIAAMSVIVDALEPLDERAQVRIVAYLQDRFGE